MVPRHFIVFLSLTSLMACPGIALAADHAVPPHDCATCHTTAQPTAGAAALRACTRPMDSTAGTHKDGDAPDFFIMDELSDIYVPVVFPHKLHASMMEMSGGCATCHHRNPEGPILRCKACHEGPSNPNDLEQPGLKGAYHRQCLSCHREWTHETKCSVCHAKRDPAKAFTPPESPGDIVGRLHPNIVIPDVHTFETKEVGDNTFVPFHHKEHAEDFQLKCAICHQKENCSTCHDMQTHEVKQARTLQYLFANLATEIKKPQPKPDERHSNCVRCHQKEIDNDCTYCHTEKDPGPFNHLATAKYDLATFHSNVNCRQCHTGQDRFEKPKNKCGDCHDKDWQPKNFDHAKVGVPLDDDHNQTDCIACHGDGYNAPVSCAACHDDGRKSFPKTPAGQKAEKPKAVDPPKA